MTHVEIDRILPIYKVEHDAMLSVRGDLTLAFEVHLPEIFTLSGEDYQALHQSFVKALKVLPSGSVFHKQDWFTSGKVKADFHRRGNSFLSLSSEHFFNERSVLDHSCYIFLTKRASQIRLSSSSRSGLLKTIHSHSTGKRGTFGEFLDAAGQFVQILSDSGFISLRRLRDDELAGTASHPGIIERYCFLLRKGEAPLVRDIHLKEEFCVGEKHCQLFTLADAADLPALCGPRINYDKYSTDRSKFSVGFASPLGQLLNCDHLYNQYIFLEDEQATFKRLEAKRLRLQSLSAYSRENAAAAKATGEFLNELVCEQRRAVKAHFNVLAWSEEAADRKHLRNKVSSALTQMDAATKLETRGAPQIWFAGMPGNAADFPMNDTLETMLEQACCFLNLETVYRSSISPFGLRLGDRISGRPVHVDISDEPMEKGIITNRNKFILGPSGSGKSFFTNHLIRSYYEQGAHVVLVDVGHSYRGLCNLTGGYYFTYSEEKPIEFNPFYLAPGEALDTEKKESIKTLLLALWKKEDESFSRAEYVALSNALNGYYRHIKADSRVFPCFNTFYNYLVDTYLKVIENGNVKEKDFDIGNFLYVLNPYYAGGEFDYLLNAKENLDLLNERMIVFELDNIKDHPILFPAVTLIIMEVFISKMRKLKGVRKAILIEECWKAIAKEGMAEYIKYLFKTVRKFFGEAIVVTQEVEDIISSPVVKQAIINNSDCKILLDQSKFQNKFEDIQQLLGLTEKEKALILSQNKANDPERKYKEVFIGLGGQMSKVYRTEVSLEEYLCYTTEESEKIKVEEYARHHGSVQKGIAALAAEMRQVARKKESSNTKHKTS